MPGTAAAAARVDDDGFCCARRLGRQPRRWPSAPRPFGPCATPLCASAAAAPRPGPGHHRDEGGESYSNSGSGSNSSSSNRRRRYDTGAGGGTGGGTGTSGGASRAGGSATARQSPSQSHVEPQRIQQPMLTDLDEGLWGIVSKLPLKRVLIWAVFAWLVYLCRPFIGVLFGTFVVSYIGSTFCQWGTRKAQAHGYYVPRRAIVGAYYCSIVLFLTSMSLVTIPRVVREGQYFISIIESSNPYVFIADSMRRALGDDVSAKVEAFMLSEGNADAESVQQQSQQSEQNALQQPQERVDERDGSGAADDLQPSAPSKPSSFKAKIAVPDSVDRLQQRQELRGDGVAGRSLPGADMEQSAAEALPPSAASSSDSIAAASADAATVAWTEERSRRLGLMMQKSMSRYVRVAVSLVSRILGDSTKMIVKALLSLVFSFMIVWDLPTVARGVRSLRRSRLRAAYLEVAPAVGDFFVLLGKSFEAQSMIALTNTTLTTFGLAVLGIPGIGFLSLLVLICSFLPVVGILLSTLPMCIVALTEYGVGKVLAVILMVALVHAVEAYVLNPQIYSAHLNLHPLVVLTVLYIAEHVYGVMGLILAVPITVYILRLIYGEPMRTRGEAGRSAAAATSTATRVVAAGGGNPAAVAVPAHDAGASVSASSGESSASPSSSAGGGGGVDMDVDVDAQA